MSHQTLFDCNGAGQITSVTDPLTHATSFAYAHGDLTTVTDPLNRTTSRFTDGGGRALSVTDPLNYVTAYTYDYLNQLTKVTDAKGRAISSCCLTGCRWRRRSHTAQSIFWPSC
jgi:YD repeat-containing protein